jgi:hypothetical protein
MRKKNKKPLRRKIVLRLPDLKHSKKAVLNNASSTNSRLNYKFAMEHVLDASADMAAETLSGQLGGGFSARMAAHAVD